MQTLKLILYVMKNFISWTVSKNSWNYAKRQ